MNNNKSEKVLKLSNGDVLISEISISSDGEYVKLLKPFEIFIDMNTDEIMLTPWLFASDDDYIVIPAFNIMGFSNPKKGIADTWRKLINPTRGGDEIDEEIDSIDPNTILH